MRRQHFMELLAHELGEDLDSGALARRGRVELSDQVTVSFERMARIVLTDFARVVERPTDQQISEDDEQQLYDDLTHLHALALGGRSRRLHVQRAPAGRQRHRG
jgi:hypothetical protein